LFAAVNGGVLPPIPINWRMVSMNLATEIGFDK
jgi:hypothetical protein